MSIIIYDRIECTQNNLRFRRMFWQMKRLFLCEIYCQCSKDTFLHFALVARYIKRYINNCGWSREYFGRLARWWRLKTDENLLKAHWDYLSSETNSSFSLFSAVVSARERSDKKTPREIILKDFATGFIWRWRDKRQNAIFLKQVLDKKR